MVKEATHGVETGISVMIFSAFVIPLLICSPERSGFVVVTNMSESSFKTKFSLSSLLSTTVTTNFPENVPSVIDTIVLPQPIAFIVPSESTLTTSGFSDLYV